MSEVVSLTRMSGALHDMNLTQSATSAKLQTVTSVNPGESKPTLRATHPDSLFL